jgi:hypothetical protein
LETAKKCAGFDLIHASACPAPCGGMMWERECMPVDIPDAVPACVPDEFAACILEQAVRGPLFRVHRVRPRAAAVRRLRMRG